MSNPPPASSSKSRRTDSSAAQPDKAARAAAFQFLSRLAAELSKGSVNLPCFPDIVLRVRKALSDPQNTPDMTVLIVGAEPRLAARLLQTANSVVFNPAGKPLTDLRTAVTRLGTQLVQSATMAFAVQQMKADIALRAIAGPLNELWEKSVTVASLCQIVARRTKIAPDEAFLTGLLHGIGRLYIMVRAVGESKGAATFNHALSELVADWHPSIGKAVLENWGFVEEIVDAIGNQSDYDRVSKRAPDLTDILIAAIGLAAVPQDGKYGFSRCASVNAFATLGLTNNECITMLKKAQYQVGALRLALGR